MFSMTAQAKVPTVDNIKHKHLVFAIIFNECVEAPQRMNLNVCGDRPSQNSTC